MYLKIYINIAQKISRDENFQILFLTSLSFYRNLIFQNILIQCL